MGPNEQAIMNVMGRYGECVDLARFEELGELFRYGCIRSDRGAGDMSGAQVARFYAATNKVHPDTGTLRTRHIASNVILDVDSAAGTAHARSYFAVHQQTPTLALQPIVAGRYHDTFHRVDDEWWFDVRMIFVDLIGDMREHLSFDLASDRPPRVD